MRRNGHYFPNGHRCEFTSANHGVPLAGVNRRALHVWAGNGEICWKFVILGSRCLLARPAGPDHRQAHCDAVGDSIPGGRRGPPK